MDRQPIVERRKRKVRFQRNVIQMLEVSNEIAILCRDGVIVEANGAGCRVLGGEDLQGLPLVRLVDADYRDIIDDLLSFRVLELEPIPVVLRRLDGGSVDAVVLIHPARELGGNYAVVTARDVSTEKRLASSARAIDRQFKVLVDNSMHLVCRCRGADIVYMNRAGCEMLKVPVDRSIAETRWAMMFQEEYRDVFVENIDAFLAETAIHPVRLQRLDGEVIDAQVMFTSLPVKGNEREFMIEAREITAHNRAVAALRRMNETLEQQVTDRTRELAEAKTFVDDLIEAIPNPVWWRDRDGFLLGYNSAFRAFHGIQGRDWIGLRVADMVPEQDPPDRSPVGEQHFEAVVDAAAGQPRHVLIKRTAWTGADARPAGVVGVMVDITELKAMEAELRRLATTDSMTGCANRRHFGERLSQTFHHCRRYRRPLSVLMLDIDRFKLINDTYGHACGDDAIRALANACMQTVRAQDCVGRLGGDEFAILAPETEMQGCLILGERLRQAIAAIAVPYGSEIICFTGSVGVAQLSEDDASPDDLMARADAALYQAKQSGRNRVAAG